MYERLRGRIAARYMEFEDLAHGETFAASILPALRFAGDQRTEDREEVSIQRTVHVPHS
jgi:hypothetical protein